MAVEKPQQQTALPASSTCSSDESSKDMCRICHCGQSEASLISPCRCRGTMGYSHPDCIIKWLSYSSKKRCELCKSKFNLEKVGYKPCYQWKMTSMTYDEVLHIILLTCCMFVIVGSITWWKMIFEGHNNYSLFFRADSMRMLVYITYGPLNILCLVLGLLEIRLVIMPIIDRWKRLNQEVKILPYRSKNKVKSQSISPNTNQATIIKANKTRRQPGATRKNQNQQHLPNLHNWLRCGTQPASSCHRPLLSMSRSAGSIEELHNRQMLEQLMIKQGIKVNLSESSLQSIHGPTTDNIVKGFNKNIIKSLNQPLTMDTGKPTWLVTMSNIHNEKKTSTDDCNIQKSTSDEVNTEEHQQHKQTGNQTLRAQGTNDIFVSFKHN